MSAVSINGRPIGPGSPVYFIAEAGSNHDRDLGQAKKLVDVAKSAGADAVKFQTFRAEALYPKRAGMTDYLKKPKSIYEIIRDLEMPQEWIPELAAHCKQVGIDFLSTPFDEKSADLLDPFIPAFKIASYEMTHHGLVQHCARKRKPLIISTGTASLDEVRETVEAARAVGAKELVLLQCTAKYPAPLDVINVRAMAAMARAFDVTVGLSDHSREALAAPMAAVALGASMIEKHFTLDNKLPGPDHAYALEPHELGELIGRVREVERALGSSEKVHQREEDELRVFARRSIFITRRVTKGETLGIGNLAVLRCGKLPYGLHPRELVRLAGRTAARDLEEEATLQAADAGPLVLREDDVSLRPLEEADAEQVVGWRARPEVAAELFAATPPTLESHREWFRSLLVRTDRLEFVIEHGGKPVGVVSLSDIDLGARSAQFGILIGEPAARGSGVAAAASRAILRHAFGALDLASVWLELFVDNAPARGLYDRLGFEADGAGGTLAAREKDGRQRPTLRMRLARDRWAALPGTATAGRS